MSTFDWESHRTKIKKELRALVARLKKLPDDKLGLKQAQIYDNHHRRMEVVFNKIVMKSSKRAYLNRFKTPVHTLNGKYTPTVLSLLDFVDANDISLDRWILAQVETIRIPHFTMFHCYGEAAHSRYESWEAKQEKKLPSKADRAKQTDSKLDDIMDAVCRGHEYAMKWVAQLKAFKVPDIQTALYFLLPHLPGWYALAYPEFRKYCMDSGLCDEKHMVRWYGEYKRSEHIRSTCAVGLAAAEKKYGKLDWK